jgi:hypothetical protein
VAAASAVVNSDLDTNDSNIHHSILSSHARDEGRRTKQHRAEREPRIEDFLQKDRKIRRLSDLLIFLSILSFLFSSLGPSAV